MTREEQIESAAADYDSDMCMTGMYEAFEAGAEWADKNPITCDAKINYERGLRYGEALLKIQRLEAMLGVAEKLYLSAENHYDSCGEAPEDCFLCKNVEKYRAEIEKLKGDGK